MEQEPEKNNRRTAPDRRKNQSEAFIKGLAQGFFVDERKGDRRKDSQTSSEENLRSLKDQLEKEFQDKLLNLQEQKEKEIREKELVWQQQSAEREREIENKYKKLLEHQKNDLENVIKQLETQNSALVKINSENKDKNVLQNQEVDRQREQELVRHYEILLKDKDKQHALEIQKLREQLEKEYQQRDIQFSQA